MYFLMFARVFYSVLFNVFCLSVCLLLLWAELNDLIQFDFDYDDDDVDNIDK